VPPAGNIFITEKNSFISLKGFPRYRVGGELEVRKSGERKNKKLEETCVLKPLPSNSQIAT
jgi:hypothetical protein